MPSLARFVAEVLARAVAVAFVSLAGLSLWVWLLGPPKLDAQSLLFRLPRLNPFFLLPALALAWCALRWRRLPALLGLRPGRKLRVRGVHPLAWPVMALSVGLFAAHFHSALFEIGDVPRKVRKSRNTGPAGMAVSISNRHAGPLVRQLVAREDPDPVVIWIDDIDKRGHTASFYAYPRLLLMEPRQREWTLRDRMVGPGGPNRHFLVGIRPSRKRSREFAEERGRPLLFAKRPGARGGPR